MPAPARIFPHPVASLDQRCDDRGDVACIDQIVERNGEVGVRNKILTIMDYDDGVGPFRRIAGGQVDRLLAVLGKRCTLHLHGFDTPCGGTASLAPLGARVSVSPALRVLTERITG